MRPQAVRNGKAVRSAAAVSFASYSISFVNGGISHGRRAGTEKGHDQYAKRQDEKGEPITQLAAYDYRTAVISDRLGMDILCVSDTGGMILFGHKSTVSVSFDEVMMMSKAIDRGSKYGLRMVDMPYWSFHVSPEQAVENAGRFVHEANAEVMKCEGNKYHAKNIEAIVRAGIPVQGHIGITPMRMPQLGGFVAQGKTAKRAKDMVDDAKAMVDAGCFSILCEVTTSEVA